MKWKKAVHVFLLAAFFLFQAKLLAHDNRAYSRTRQIKTRKALKK